MAIAMDILGKGLRGGLGRKVVYKDYNKKTVVTSFPDMTGIKPSKEQKKLRGRFAEAVAYAKVINADPDLKKQYEKKVKKGQSVFQYAIQEYLKRPVTP